MFLHLCIQKLCTMLFHLSVWNLHNFLKGSVTLSNREALPGYSRQDAPTLSAGSVQKEAPSCYPQSQHGFPVCTDALEALPAPQATNNETLYYFKLQLHGYRQNPCVLCAGTFTSDHLLAHCEVLWVQQQHRCYNHVCTELQRCSVLDLF